MVRATVAHLGELYSGLRRFWIARSEQLLVEIRDSRYLYAIPTMKILGRDLAMDMPDGGCSES